MRGVPSDEHGRIRSEHDRIWDEYEAKLSEYEERLEDLERENEWIRREKRLILKQREENTELVTAVKEERSFAKTESRGRTVDENEVGTIRDG